ncbi:hypothetical protein [Phaeocystidibacter luteus]|uniref:Uncharacterized protein n=1 Tax=Phaeocystidibacter luteus TaxID=911197 RepID=A0A6N6RL06_9FLAO|nr:hypothetical protein [Phaeocystidibacter luteus]KAB2814237.1 hypothetical protein F8C67_00475 [Phaeocystidibacter luteus]
MIRKVILLFIFSVLTFVHSQGQFLDKYTHTSQFTETRFMEIMNDEVYYVRLDYDSEFTEAETWLVRADRQLETIHEVSLNQQLGLPDSVSVYVSDMKVYQSSYVHLTYTTTDWRNSNGLTQSGFLNYTADLTNVSDYSIALNDTNGVVILGSLDHNSALYVY